MPRLIILTKGRSVKQVNITGRLTTIGRTEGNSLVMESDRVSRSHAVIDWNGDRYVITDVGSRNGTFVNGMRIRQRPLANGDTISIGDCELRFLYNTKTLSESEALRLVTIPGALADLDAAAALAARHRPKAPEGVHPSVDFF
ncbi:FHA domain-containing protein [Variovorax sp. J22R133]|uniref:FHA domain-containing protein n=1 Tax=Variovorax brevis TaxID=3053503 RepID=UPI002578C6B8|nr:FHA domain-containing protein [Variovorax sp. J22R133]MDM0113911.1 FHA domain-containing protein [Variovorax sp. J22R133]